MPITSDAELAADPLSFGEAESYHRAFSELMVPSPAPPTFTATFVAGAIVVTFSVAVLNTPDLLDSTKYSVTPPGGAPAVSVTGVTYGGTQVTLAIAGDVRGGGAYQVALLANTARSSVTGGGNVAAAAGFTITAAALAVVSATPLSATTLRVAFSKAVRQVSSGNSDDALHVANYAITSSAGSLAVSAAASVQSDTVDLTTAAEMPGFYTLTVSNVKDLAGNAI